ncbi:multidrug efflux pump subunit AcrB [Paraperlucidibaca baekdonensis]|uniref:Multidrug efflux pump subunit AcrB n=1 Tax=Paraperlucidibaca baekdonensis TaxID=748120 RepID=A0A3E0H5Y9_9GAMM|nr:efflux RND transporter permease subunit [Paraperlucidibaca baekdonensis]REH38941.1 multidrug efflux pump subunit AcrB [Paraperlucidibaca baekdonensis]
MKGFNLSEWAVTHRTIVIFLMIASLLAGVFSFLKLGRLEDPNFNVPAMTAVVIWPGASAEELQNQVLNRMEQAVQELPHLNYVQSFSRQGFGGMTLSINGRQSSAELKELWYQARKKISDRRGEFPAGVQGPFYNDEYTDVYTSLYALRGDDISQAELQEFAEHVKRRLQTVPNTNKVNILGEQAEKVYVELSTRRLAALGLSPQAVFAAIAEQNQVRPAGAVDTYNDRVFARIDGSLQSAADVAEVSIEAGGNLLRLGDIATVTSGYEDPAQFLIRHNGHAVLAIGVTMVPDGNILTLGRDLEKELTAIRAELPVGVEIEQYADQSKVAEQSVWEFEKVFLEALIIVLAVSFLFLGWRTGIVVAASVPLVLGIVAVLMYAFGWHLDRITLGALIIALGLLVDDAIIAVEMMVVKMEQGWDRVRAATFAYTSTAFPMLTGTLVTIAGFMPVGFAESTSGEYAGGIFWIVGMALVVSWFVAVIFTPYLGVVMLPNNLAEKAHNDPYNKPVYHRLRRWVDFCVDHRKSVLLATGGLFIAAILGMKLVQQQFFPTASRPELLVELRLKEGSSIKATEREVKRLESLLLKDEDIDYFTAYVGQGSPRFYISLAPELPNPAYAQFVIQTGGLAQREAVRTRLMTLFDEDQVFPQLRGRVLRLEFGPPVGFPVQFRVIGPDPMEVRRIAYEVRDTVRASALVRDTQLDWNDQVRVMKVRIDQNKARLLGVSSVDIANLLQTALSGAPVSQIRRGEELIDIVVRGTPEERARVENIGDLSVFSRTGGVVPLSQVASIEPVFEEPVLWRRNRHLQLTVKSDLADGVQGPYATQQIWPSLQPIIDALPPGYELQQGGAIEESLKANKAIGAVFPVMLIVMLMVLMFQLQSFSRMFMVFLTAPLGLIGVVPALLLFNVPFGFVALLGVIALAGMIMRNSVILVDQIEQDIAAGHEPWQAIVDATVRRSRPVVLTAAAAVLAMVPLSTSVFWGPMAISIMGGLVFATGLTLLFVPALYAAWFKVKRAS